MVELNTIMLLFHKTLGSLSLISNNLAIILDRVNKDMAVIHMGLILTEVMVLILMVEIIKVSKTRTNIRHHIMTIHLQVINTSNHIMTSHPKTINISNHIMTFLLRIIPETIMEFKVFNNIYIILAPNSYQPKSMSN